jgi:hypothetical protein
MVPDGIVCVPELSIALGDVVEEYRVGLVPVRFLEIVKCGFELGQVKVAYAGRVLRLCGRGIVRLR